MSRQKYRFDEDRTLRADSFPEACVGWPCSGLTAAPPTGRSGDVPIPGTAWVSPPALHPGRRALRRPPIAVRLPRPAPADSRSIRSRRRFGSPAERASLATGRGESPTGPSYGGLMTLHFLEDERSQGVVGGRYADNRRIVSRPCLLPVRVANGEGDHPEPKAKDGGGVPDRAPSVCPSTPAPGARRSPSPSPPATGRRREVRPSTTLRVVPSPSAMGRRRGFRRACLRRPLCHCPPWLSGRPS